MSTRNVKIKNTEYKMISETGGLLALAFFNHPMLREQIEQLKELGVGTVIQIHYQVNPEATYEEVRHDLETILSQFPTPDCYIVSGEPSIIVILTLMLNNTTVFTPCTKRIGEERELRHVQWREIPIYQKKNMSRL